MLKVYSNGSVRAQEMYNDNSTQKDVSDDSRASLIQGQHLCRLHKSPSDETIDRGPPGADACKKITYAR